MAHAPVLLAEVLAALKPADGEFYVDGTFGGGGYTRAILGAAACGVTGIDRDPDALARGRTLEEHYAPRFGVLLGRFGEMDTLIDKPADGVVLDLGVSSFQIDEAERGFSFQQDALLDMRMSKSGPSAADAVNALSEAALSELLDAYGEENDHRRIARFLVQARAAGAITHTLQLADLVEKAVGGRRGAKIHPATRTFQALRILVNDELGEVARGLVAAERLLKPGGRLVIVSFHSLEDRRVKSFFVERSGGGGQGSRHAPDLPKGPAPSFRLETRRTITPGEAEMSANPRARSASLRYAIRTDAPAWASASAPELAPKAESEWGRLA
ncbi:MAG: 16S rRNA (cytosine(1402)-N(4))-methyltransferase RsmH [Caulobacterales bacterium]